MSDRSKRISDLLKSQRSRTAYIKAKLGVLVPAQIRALRLKSANPPMPFQKDLAKESELHQSRISMFETPGAANITVETLAKIAAALRVGVIIMFVPFSDMLRWENAFSPDQFSVTPLPMDKEFLNPEQASVVEISPISSANAVEELVSVSNNIAATVGDSGVWQGSLAASAMAFGAGSEALGGAA